MLAQVLALMAAAAAAPPPDAPPQRTVSPVTVSPAPAKPPIAATVDVVGDEAAGNHDFVAIWPDATYQMGVDGRVTLSCLIDVHGLAERCQVLSETPNGRRLGRAALELRPTLQLTPAKGPDGAAVNAVMAISISFRAPKKFAVGPEATNGSVTQRDVAHIVPTQMSEGGNPLAMRRVTMLDNPVWAQAASFDDLAAAYPPQGAGVEGYAAAHCRIERSGGQAGALRDCEIIKEAPLDHGFGKAALGLTARFRLAPDALARAPNHTPVWVDIPIRLPPPAASADRTVMAPVWILGLDPKATPRIFPPEAAASGLASGRGVARCNVAADGSLGDCVPEPGDPDGLGFSKAAAKLATGMKMNLWSADGAPVEGGVVHIPIRLNLKGAD